MSTNIGFLERLLVNEDFRSGDVHTGFIEVSLKYDQGVGEEGDI